MLEVATVILDPLGFIAICGGMVAYLYWEQRRHRRTHTTTKKEPTKCGRRTPTR